MLVVLKMVLAMVVEFILMKFPKFWSDFGAGDDFLGVDLVESIDKGSMFDLGYSINR